MGWVYRNADLHRCAKPEYTASVTAGDVWECDVCHTQHKVDGIDGDQRDGSTWIKWKVLPTHQSSISHQRDGWDGQR